VDQVTEQLDGTLRERVVDSIGRLLPTVLKREVPAMPESTRLADELQLTSSTTLALLLEVEEDLEIQIDVEDIDQRDLETIGSLASFVAEHALANE
jgi:acyl carrier protein